MVPAEETYQRVGADGQLEAWHIGRHLFYLKKC
jgi:hypothetical protein